VRAEPFSTTMTPVMAEVESSTRELVDTVTLGLSMPDPLPMPLPGQFAMLWVPGVGEIPISYSGIGPGRRVEHTVRVVGATSAALAALITGDPVGVRGPFGRGWRLGELVGADVLIIAGGLGLAPLRPAVEAAAAAELGAASVQLLVGARSPDLVLFGEQIGERWGDLRPRVTVDHARDEWPGPVGPLHVDLADPFRDLNAAAALVCGPEIMMQVIGRQLVVAGVRPERIQVSLERNMQCGVGHCGHCQLGPLFTCADGPVVGWDVAAPLLAVRER
jgi:anaerobic sulfite reductase subunit B